MTPPLWFWLVIAVLVLVLVIDAIRDWREGGPFDYLRDWDER